MKWYSAHLVLMVQLKGKRQKRFPVWENIVLVKAKDHDDAFAKAEEQGRLQEGDDEGTFVWGGESAEWIFAGVRKVTECADSERRPGEGTEITFNEYELDSRAAVDKYARGELVTLTCRDLFAEDEESLPKISGERKPA